MSKCNDFTFSVALVLLKEDYQSICRPYTKPYFKLRETPTTKFKLKKLKVWEALIHLDLRGAKLSNKLSKSSSK